MTDAHISRVKQIQVAERMAALGIRDEDLTERFILGSGHGGQKINKTSSCVYLKHEGSGIEVKVQRSRSRELNRYHARVELCERFAERVRGEKTRRQQEREKIRRQKRRRSRRQQERMLEGKHRQSDKKRARAAVSRDQA